MHLSSARATAYPLARSSQSGCRRWQHSRSILLERYTQYATTPTNHYGHGTGQSGRGGKKSDGSQRAAPSVSSPVRQDNPIPCARGIRPSMDTTPISVPSSDVVYPPTIRLGHAAYHTFCKKGCTTATLDDSSPIQAARMIRTGIITS